MTNHTNASKKRLQVGLMYKEAKCRNDDAELLEGSISTKSDSGHLLRLLAFELSLKCLLVIHDIYPTSHDYDSLMKKLPDEVYSQIFKLAEERMTSHADYSDHENILNEFSKNFIALRYPYERYQNMTEEEYLQYGNLGAEIGLPVEEAEFKYYPSELYGLICALLNEAEKWLDENPPAPF